MAFLLLVGLTAFPARGAELKPATAAAFDHYVQVSEARMAAELRDGPYLRVDALPEAQRATVYADLRRGKLLIENKQTRENGKAIKIPDGMVHHWVALAFIPRTTLEQVLALIQNYDNHAVIYSPDVRKSKLLAHHGDEYRVYLQLYRKSIVTVVLNTEYDIRFHRDGKDRVSSRSYSTRVAEVVDAGEPDEHERPVDDGHGYVWRLYTYWRFEQKDGGVYVQVETIGLSRGIPWILAWLVNPLIRNLPREALSDLLTATRKAVEKEEAAKAARAKGG